MKNTTEQSFTYKAIDQRGLPAQGQIIAINTVQARRTLQKQGFHKITLHKKTSLSFAWVRPVRTMDLMLFFGQLSTLLQAGISLTLALEITRDNTQNPTLKARLNSIKTDVQSGTSLTAALSKHSNIFDRLSIALVQAGEASGTLDEMLSRYHEHSEKTYKLQTKLKKSLQYPITVAVVAIIVTMVLLIKVVPVFSQMFLSMGTDLPTPTKMVMAVSDSLQSYLWLMVIVLSLVATGFLYLKKSSAAFQAKLDRLILKLPIIGSLSILVMNARFTRLLACEFGAGVNLVKAIKDAANSTDNTIFIREIDKISHAVTSGDRLYIACQEANSRHATPLFLPMTLQMIRTGEESGRLSELLTKAADYQEQMTNDTLDRLVSLIEPITIITLGLVVGGLVLSMYLPVFEMGQQM
ncbi:type II secretion system F family protein [Moraxella nasovis]|uniref:type II secretion system F family protein n=1 Tax=Moraxella nasovis TaxID=2904121 RepID=UPI001F620513|nr:type II secretion system F family protein [Moraxella nasovis]UNU72586.1 type II secretion system F family protein [Moraxella nasovis]